MILKIDTDVRTLSVERAGKVLELDLYSKEAFEIVSRQWVRIGWNQKYQYTFSWLGRPIIQLPEDMVRAQEVIFRVAPDVIVETGIAHGGSLVYYASLCKILGRGRVIGIDIDIKAHNRDAIEKHLLSEYITIIEGSSVDLPVIEQARSRIAPGDVVLVILDSNHTAAHVIAELEAYHSFVTLGSYIVATDGIMFDLADVPRGHAKWDADNPMLAAEAFVADHPEFVIEHPAWPFNESDLTANITHWPGAWLKRTS